MTASRQPAAFHRSNQIGGSSGISPRWMARAFAFAALGFAGTAWAAPAAAPAPLHFGFSNQTFVDVNESDARTAIKIWAKTLGDERGIPVDEASELLVGTEAIGKALRSGRVDMVAMTATELWSMGSATPIKPTIILGVTNGVTTHELLLLVNRDSPAAGIADLRGRSVVLMGVSQGSLSSAWIETLLLEKHLGRAETFFANAAYVTKVSRAVLPVFFGQTDACVVTADGFRLMSELNPQVGQRLKALARSGPLVSTVFAFRGTLDSPSYGKLLAQVDGIAQRPRGRQILLLFHTEQIIVRPVSDLNDTFALLDRHQRLLAEEDHSGKSGLAPAAGAR